MFEGDLVANVSALATADPAVCDRDTLADLVQQSQSVRGWLDALDVRISLRASQLAELGACEGAAGLLTGGGRRTARDATAVAARAGVCATMPALHDALASGVVSAGHVDAVARVRAGLDDAGRAELRDLEAALVASAATMPVEGFERECRDLARILSRDDGESRLAQQRQRRKVRRWVDRQTGMAKTLLELDPETDARVAAALDAAIATARAERQDPDVNWDHLTADALVGLITGARTLDPRVPDISVLIDLDTLLNGPNQGSVAETVDGAPLPVTTLRRLACDADIIPVVLGGSGEVLDVGRGRRLATATQRRALRAMYRTCAHPDCTVRVEACRIHHVQWWEHHGVTDLANLVPLCNEHHHLVHEGGWTLTLTPDRTITLHRPDGTIHYEDNTTNRTTPATATATADDAYPSESETPQHPRERARRPPPSAPVSAPEPGNDRHQRDRARPDRREPRPTDATEPATGESNPLAPPTLDLPTTSDPADDAYPHWPEIPRHLRERARRTPPPPPPTDTASQPPPSASASRNDRQQRDRPSPDHRGPRPTDATEPATGESNPSAPPTLDLPTTSDPADDAYPECSEIPRHLRERARRTPPPDAGPPPPGSAAGNDRHVRDCARPDHCGPGATDAAHAAMAQDSALAEVSGSSVPTSTSRQARTPSMPTDGPSLVSGTGRHRREPRSSQAP